MRPFIKRVPSLKALKHEGTDEHFFQGQDYAEVPPPLISTLYEWCKENSVANTALPSKGAVSEEPQEIYYVELSTKAGRNELKAMLKALAPVLVASVAGAASTLTAENFLSARANDAADDLSAIIEFRNALVRFSAKLSKAANPDPSLIIGV